MNTVDELVDFIFVGTNAVLYDEFAGWVRESKRFRAFATVYRDKIRAKLKNVRDVGGMLDLRAELETAMLLLKNERFTLEYEKYAALKQRGPDFTVTYRTHTPFNVEVRRMRGVEQGEGETVARAASGRDKLMAVLSDKIGQMPPSIVNVLWLTAEREISMEDVNGAVKGLRQLPEHQASDGVTRRVYVSAADFDKQLPRLSGIVLRRVGGVALWLNPVARHVVPQEIVTGIQRLDVI